MGGKVGRRPQRLAPRPYGGPCIRTVLPAGGSTLRYKAVTVIPDATKDMDPSARGRAGRAPDDALLYTLPSLYYLADVLGDEDLVALRRASPRLRRVQAVCDYVPR